MLQACIFPLHITFTVDIYQEEIDLGQQIIYFKIMLQGFLRIVLYALLAYIIYKFIRIYQRLSKKSSTPAQTKKSAGLMVKDEICNTYLPKEEAIKEIIEGKEYFFCSKECRQKFLESRK